MKAILIVEGKTYPVVNMRLAEKGIESVGVFKNGIYTTFYDINSNISHFIEKPLQIDFGKALKLNNKREEKLIEHLEIMLKDETDDLTGIAFDIAEIDVVDKTSFLELLDKKTEYKLRQQRALGMIDAVEEVKAFLEDYMLEDVDLSGGEEID